MADTQQLSHSSIIYSSNQFNQPNYLNKSNNINEYQSQLSQLVEHPINGSLFFQNIEQKIIQPTKIKLPKQFTYSFPIQLLKIKILAGKKQFQSKIREQGGHNSLHKGWAITKQKLIKGCSSIYIRCIYCKANIHYQEKDQKWILIKYTNSHIHSIKDKKAYKMISKQAIMQNLSLSNNELFNKLNQSYPIKRMSLMQTKRNLLKNSPSFSIIKQLLQSLDYELKYQKSQQQILPEVLVACSLEQRKSYRKYGQCISFDIFENCMKQISLNGNRYGLAVFSGFDANNRIIIFGFCISTFINKNQFKNIICWFLDLMGFNPTTAIITNKYQNQYLNSAFKELKIQKKVRFHHIYDNWHFIRSFMYSLKGNTKQIIKKIINILTKCMHETVPIIGKKLLCDLQKIMLQSNYQIEYFRLIELLPHICVWNMPNQFIGLGLHSNQGINQFLKIKEEGAIFLYQLIERLHKVSKQRFKKSIQKKQYESYNFELYFEDRKIEQVRLQFQKRVFNSFIQNYNRSQFYITQSCQKQNYFIKNINDNSIYLIKNSLCECHSSQKTGIPCQHLIYLYKNEYQQSYINLFNKRWLVIQENDTSIKMSGRRRKSRRNRKR